MILISMIMLFALASCNTRSIQEDPARIEEETVEVSPKINEDKYIYRHRSTMEKGNDREQYIWEVLRLSLEATVDDFGPYEIEPVDEINQIRDDVELIHNTGMITIISDSLNEMNLKELDQIQVPLMCNLLGYRVFFIRADRQDDFDHIAEAEDLKSYKFGIAFGWNDKIILEHSGYKVHEEEIYGSLYRGLESGIFDIFSRGVNEVQGEYQTYKESYPKLHIEENILLYYPLPRYFWFSKTEYGQKLKNRVEVGLNRIIEDGTFYQLFDEYFAETLETLDLDDRILIELENPIYDKNFEAIDLKYRYNPLDNNY